jgi:hypothetical protein
VITRIIDKLMRMIIGRTKSSTTTLSPIPAAEQLAAESALRLNEAIESLTTQHLTQSWGDRLLTLDKTAGFRNDPTFEVAFASVKGSHIYDQYNGPDTVAWRLNTLCWAARCGLKVGSFLNWGVGFIYFVCTSQGKGELIGL